VHASHEVGKSLCAAVAVGWWLDVHPPGTAFVVTSAPTAPQVRAILWREIARLHARGGLPGRLNQTEWFLPIRKPDGTFREELVAFGRKPADQDPTAFQGLHQRYMLVVLDESCGIPKNLFVAADSLIANDDSRMLAIGNPDDPRTEFAEVCKPGSGWNVIHISAFDSPNFTGEDVPDEIRPLLVGKTWVEEKRRKWGESNPLWKSKVEGEFPEQTDGGLISPGLVLAAQNRRLSLGEPRELGVDVGAGGDENVVYARWGPVARRLRRDRQPDTMKTLGNVLAHKREVEATAVKIDKCGVGLGAVNRAAELGEASVIGINVGEGAANNEEFENLRAEGYWGLRERFIDGDIDLDPDDLDLAAELVAIKYDRSSRGRTKIESKDEMRKRLDGRSPDNADALMLCFLDRRPAVFDPAAIAAF